MKFLRLLFLLSSAIIAVFATGEKIKFDASVNKLMNIIINSLYKSKDVFLRELISNASDALDKIRFLSLSGKENLGANKDLNITIQINKQDNTIIITDSGVGMTKEDLKNNLGTIARSGTSEFMSKLQGGESASNLIGKFGVGFYSVFLIADRVQVISKNNHDQQLIWESMNQDDFTITPDSNGDTLERGTRIIMHVKEDAKEFLDTGKLRNLIETHSQYIQFPIYLWESKTVEEEVVDQKEDLEVEDVTENEEKPKIVKKEVFDWERINKQKPIWVRKPADVSQEDYYAFYKAFSKDINDPIAFSHFRAEGDVEFSSLFFVPRSQKEDVLMAYTKAVRNLKIFVRRVFITDELTDLLPKFLSFITGVIDSDDLPLNVSRETLQNNSQLKIIKKKILGKVLDMIKNLMDNDEDYLTFYKEYGKSLKMGILENQVPPKTIKKIMTFLRFYSSKTGVKKMISLSDYVKGMAKNQPQIYYVLGESIQEIETLPYLENILAKGYEVLYLTDPLDPYLAQTEYMKTHENITLQNIAKSGVDLGGDDKDVYEEQKKKFEPLLSRLKKTLSIYINDARISRQLSTSPCAVIASGQSLDAASEKLIKSQQQQGQRVALLDYYLRQKFTLEINPNSPIMIKLLEKAEDTSDVIEDTLHVLFESTIIASGYSVRNTKKFGLKIQTVIKKSLGIEAVLDEGYNEGYSDGSEKETTDGDTIESYKDAIDNVVKTHDVGGDSSSDKKQESDSFGEEVSKERDEEVSIDETSHEEL